jgi:hypothetical protein
MIELKVPPAYALVVPSSELPSMVIDYVYFCYRAIEIWQRLIPFKYGSVHYDDCARCYARLGKLLAGSAREVSIPHAAVAVEVVSTRLFHLAADNPPVAARLLETVMRTMLRSDAAVRWARDPSHANDPHAAVIRRFSELSEVFNRQVIGLWPDHAIAERDYSSARRFCESSSRIYGDEIAGAGGPNYHEDDHTRSM